MFGKARRHNAGGSDRLTPPPEARPSAEGSQPSNAEAPAAIATWLTVGGCPRSGTTALGDEINKSRHVALLHEYNAAHLFATVNQLFGEELRLAEFAESNQELAKLSGYEFEHHLGLFSRARDERRIVAAIFEIICGKRVAICGTKMPGYHFHRAPALPAGVRTKTIHITRHPHAVVYSYARKMTIEGYSSDPERIFDTALAHWISSWNHMIDAHGAKDFLHLFHESIAEAPATTAARIAAFLGIEADFGLQGFVLRPGAQPLQGLREMGHAARLEKLDAIDFGADWLTYAQAAIRGRTYFGFPLELGGAIDMGTWGNGWKYTLSGFHEAEPRGCWIKGIEARLVFSPTRDYSGALMLAFSIPWSFEEEGRAQSITLEFDGRIVGQVDVALGQNNGGTGAVYSFVLQDVALVRSRAVVVRFLTPNSRNAARLGISDDDRDLSVMLERVQIVPLGG